MVLVGINNRAKYCWMFVVGLLLLNDALNCSNYTL
jgi:hypothetical protein